MKLDNRMLAGIGVVVGLALGAKLFGFPGLRTLVAMLVIFVLPSYFILRNFDLDGDEVVFLSLFMGLSLGSLSVWYINRVVPSLTISLGVMVALGIIVGLFLHRHMQHRKK